MTRLSHDKGATDVPLIEQTLGAFFDDACAMHAAREALVSRHQNDRLTYAELKRRVDALACSLIRLGLEKGDRVAIWSQNNVEWLLTQHATAKAGLVLVNINPAYRRAELEYAVNKVGCRAIVLSPAFKTSDYIEMISDLAPELAACAPGALKAAKLPTLQFVIRLGAGKTPGMLNFDDLLTPPSDAERQALAALGQTLKADEPINIQFTSGTTGNPKGATLTHRNILNNGFFVGEAIRLTEKDKICVPVPLYHCFGMVMANLGALTHGSGENRSNAPRDGIIVSYCLGWLKQYENQFLAYPPAVARSFPTPLQRLIGYQMHRPNLGGWEGQDPIQALATNPHTLCPHVDALTPDIARQLKAHYGEDA